MMVSVRAFNSMTLATSTLNAITACIAMKVADVSSTRKWVSDAHQMKLVEGNLCVSLKPLSQPTACARRSYLCPRTPWFCRCIRLIWQIPTLVCSCINKTSRKFAAQVISIKLQAAVSPVSNQRTRAVFACPTWIAPQLTQLSSRNASADIHRKEPNIVI